MLSETNKDLINDGKITSNVALDGNKTMKCSQLV